MMKSVPGGCPGKNPVTFLPEVLIERGRFCFLEDMIGAN